MLDDCDPEHDAVYSALVRMTTSNVAMVIFGGASGPDRHYSRAAGTGECREILIAQLAGRNITRAA